MIFNLRSIALLLPLLLGANVTSHAANPPVQSEQFVDGIAAIVDQKVITLSQLTDKMNQIRVQMQQQNIPVPPESTFKRQVLQQMINDALQDAEAKRLGIHVSDDQVQHTIQTIAQRNRIGIAQLKQEILADGISWERYQSEIRDQIQDDILRQQFVENRINISDNDIDAFLKTHGDMPLPQMSAQQGEPETVAAAPTGPELVELAQILIEVPDYASDDVVQEKRQKAESILKKLRAGADFAGVAAESSEGPQALQGGDMGIRPLEDWPDLFVKAIAETPAGNISSIIQSGRGFHILKVLRRGYAQAPEAAQAPAPVQQTSPRQNQPVSMVVTQTHASHILIKTTAVRNDDKARSILDGLYTRIQHGESFAELAKRYSEDASGPKGGDLGWLNPGDTVPAFEQAMDSLAIGGVSEPIKSNFGWHLIKVEDRRQKDMKDEVLRMRARQELMERRIGPAYEDWLDTLRSHAYIDNRLEKTITGNR